ncbi:hypothetical protein NQ314_012679 [Rhamnusium bicolor]|uniref:THAP-type domain-containing protein n=1 Tax=Rhamnusium bicolor TaxID=1586634 RepID=A0AAV8XAN5_9CUCU|nr:hypothetical protein NQ314_012679 [Rhamnusium bicolor]
MSIIMTRRTVATCKNSSSKTGRTMIYHSFPKNKTIRDVWVQRCKRDGKWNPDSYHVCSAHFTDEDYERDLKGELLNIPLKKKLQSGVVPSVNLSSIQRQNNPLGESNQSKRKDKISYRDSKKLVTELLNIKQSDNLLTIPEEHTTEQTSIASSDIHPDRTFEEVLSTVPEGIPYCHHSHDFQAEKIDM